MHERQLSLLVGDNPFHGISHLSQVRARARYEGQDKEKVEYAANLVELSLWNGANGFMFSVDETTLSILRILSQRNKIENISMYAIVPYAYEYVRQITQIGGVSGLAKKLALEMLFSSNAEIIALNLIGLIKFDITAFLKTYVAYEMSRIKSAVKGLACLKSVLLHEIITDMSLALNLKRLFKSYIQFMKESGVRPGFETRNFAYLVKKFNDWNIDFNEINITASFNKVGFQMCPSKTECEKALKDTFGAEVKAI